MNIKKPYYLVVYAYIGEKKWDIQINIKKYQ